MKTNINLKQVNTQKIRDRNCGTITGLGCHLLPEKHYVNNCLHTILLYFFLSNLSGSFEHFIVSRTTLNEISSRRKHSISLQLIDKLTIGISLSLLNAAGLYTMV